MISKSETSKVPVVYDHAQIWRVALALLFGTLEVHYRRPDPCPS
jgi:hypothetical protein